MGSFEYDPIGRASVLTLLNRRIREPYVRWCERSTNQLMISLLLDFEGDCKCQHKIVQKCEYKYVQLHIALTMFIPLLPCLNDLLTGKNRH